MELTTYNRKQYQNELKSINSRITKLKEIIQECDSLKLKSDYIKYHNTLVRQAKKIREILIEDITSGIVY